MAHSVTLRVPFLLLVFVSASVLTFAADFEGALDGAATTSLAVDEQLQRLFMNQVVSSLKETLTAEFGPKLEALENRVKELEASKADLALKLEILQAACPKVATEPIATTEATAADAAADTSSSSSPGGRRMLQSALENRIVALENRVLAVEKKLTYVVADKENNFCIGLSCFVPSGSFLAIRHKDTKAVLLSLEHSTVAGDIIRVYGPGLSTSKYFFINRTLSFGVWDSSKGVPFGQLRVAQICPDNNCPRSEIVRKLTAITTATDNSTITVNRICLGPTDPLCLAGSYPRILSIGTSERWPWQTVGEFIYRDDNERRFSLMLDSGNRFYVNKDGEYGTVW